LCYFTFTDLNVSHQIRRELERRKEKVIALCPHEIKFCVTREEKKNAIEKMSSREGGGVGSQPAP